MPDLPSLERLLPASKRDLAELVVGAGLAERAGGAIDSMRTELITHLSQQEQMEPLLATLSPDALQFLVGLAWHSEGRIYGNRLQPPGPNRTYHGLRALAEEMRPKGLLFSLGSHDYYAVHPGYTMAYESAPWIGVIGAVRLAGKDRRLFHPLAEGSGGALGCEWLHDLIRILGEMVRKPIGITQQGALYRRDVERLSRLLTPRRAGTLSEAFEELARDLFPYAAHFGPWRDDAPPELGLLLWLSMSLGLVRVSGGVLQPVKDWQRKIERASPTAVWQRALQAVVNLHRQDLSALCSLMLLSDEWWLSVSDLLQVIRPSRASVFKDSLPVGPASMFRTLSQIGALEATMIAGGPAVRLNAIGMAMRTGAMPSVQFSQHWTVLGNDDILVPPDFDPSALARLESIASPAKVDAVSIYRISPTTLRTAVEGGLRYESIVSMLEQHAASGLPQSMRFRLEEWLGRAGRYRFVEAALLVCRSADDAKTALGIRAVRDSVIEVLAETCFVIPAADEEKVRAALEREGLVPEQDVQRPSGVYREDALRAMSRPDRALRVLRWGHERLVEPL